MRLIESPLNALGDWHDRVTWGSHDQKAEQYLKDATKEKVLSNPNFPLTINSPSQCLMACYNLEIVLRDLLLCLKQSVTRRTETNHLKPTFDCYCYGKIDDEKCEFIL